MSVTLSRVFVQRIANIEANCCRCETLWSKQKLLLLDPRSAGVLSGPPCWSDCFEWQWRDTREVPHEVREAIGVGLGGGDGGSLFSPVGSPDQARDAQPGRQRNRRPRRSVVQTPSFGTISEQIALALPPGRRNLLPKLTFTYVSTGGVDLAGVGWQLYGARRPLDPERRTVVHRRRSVHAFGGRRQLGPGRDRGRELPGEVRVAVSPGHQGRRQLAGARGARDALQVRFDRRLEGQRSGRHDDRVVDAGSRFRTPTATPSPSSTCAITARSTSRRSTTPGMRRRPIRVSTRSRSPTIQRSGPTPARTSPRVSRSTAFCASPASPSSPGARPSAVTSSTTRRARPTAVRW